MPGNFRRVEPSHTNGLAPRRVSRREAKGVPTSEIFGGPVECIDRTQTHDGPSGPEVTHGGDSCVHSAITVRARDDG